MNHNALARKNLEKRFAMLREVPMTVPPRGWIRAIRNALGLSAQQLAVRMGVSQSRVSVLEKAEAAGSTTLNSLRQAAAAMDCTLVYAVVPNMTLDDMLRRRSEAIADSELRQLHHSMRLENQAMSQEDFEAERTRLINELLAGPARILWNKL